MFQIVTTVVKWVFLSALLIAAMFWRFAASHSLLLDLAVCMGALVLAQRAFGAKQYFGMAGLVAIAVVFSPVLLILKIFLLLGLSCAATFAVLLATLRPQPLLAG